MNGYINQPKYCILPYLQARLHLLQQRRLHLHCLTGSDPQTIYMGLSRENVESLHYSWYKLTGFCSSKFTGVEQQEEQLKETAKLGERSG